ncbi:UDP-glycosyltransferase UGT4-like isoform X1 [Macrosteles quadrilineatus]|uniref:UDP-glycosyltransferase UGT4-like isoform X1 n=1 Tax=Macrosteles quadrilineatus TaxID=74068 RepID=UPI0023E2EDA7|nr:UDP-glycosyltransferase UGT4-like isoform X1 [Macrosteles quadrilineatus]
MLPMWAKSHHNFLRPVMKALAAAGHEVVNYTPFPLDKPPPNYTDIFLENIKPDCKELADYFIEITDFPEWKCVDLYWPLHLLTYPWFIEDPKVQELLTGKDKFDLIFIEGTTVHEHTLVMGRIFNAPIISLQTFALNNFLNSHAGNDYQLSYIPDTCLSLSNRMSFQDRLFNAFTSIRGLYHYHNSQLRSLEAMMKKAFPDLPPIAEMARNISLHFVNDHVTADYAQPRPPNVIGVGGIHIEPNKPLPNEIKKFMDEAPAGVIFFSLGTYVNDDIKPKEYFDMYINVFKRFKERVIWKTRKGDIEGLPPNVLTLK